VAGSITPSGLLTWLRIVLPLALLINLFGPLGFIGGGLSIFAIGCGVLYNFYFKFTALSWLPYAVAFASLPSCMALSKGYLPPLWMWLGGALFGVAAHFLNVIKDMKEDHLSGIRGLPQRCGSKVSIVVAVVLVLIAVALLVFSDLSLPPVAP
jgi:4-hydroxybenzoate polyprenyltransferase